jgi:hypothetical protein
MPGLEQTGQCHTGLGALRRQTAHSARQGERWYTAGTGQNHHFSAKPPLGKDTGNSQDPNGVYTVRVGAIEEDNIIYWSKEITVIHPKDVFLEDRAHVQ